jgi:hypothetical protein
MNDAVSVEVLNCRKDLHDILGSFLLGEWSPPYDLLVQVIESIFHTEIDFISTDMISICR